MLVPCWMPFNIPAWLLLEEMLLKKKKSEFKEAVLSVVPWNILRTSEIESRISLVTKCQTLQRQYLLLEGTESNDRTRMIYTLWSLTQMIIGIRIKLLPKRRLKSVLFTLIKLFIQLAKYRQSQTTQSEERRCQRSTTLSTRHWEQ